MRVALCLLLLSACTPGGTIRSDRAPQHPAIIESGRLENSVIGEASGLAHSPRQAGLLWTMNDGGSEPLLFAISETGRNLGSVRLRHVKNIDWEDLATFELDGKSWVLVADVGDNFSRRDHVTLHIFEEPGSTDKSATSSWQIDVRYPDGPLDVEAVAVDAREQKVYALSKRTVPARLYSMPLTPERSGSDNIVTASLVGDIGSIPQPTQEDLDRALAEKNWHWQPTAMDFSPDGTKAIILTYRALYLFHRENSEPWIDALQRQPVAFNLGEIENAESASLGDEDIFVTVESVHAPVYRIRY